MGYDKTGLRVYDPATDAILSSRHVKVIDDVLGVSYFKEQTQLKEILALGASNSQVDWEAEVDWDLPVHLAHLTTTTVDDYQPPTPETSSHSYTPDSSLSSQSNGAFQSRLPVAVASRRRNLRDLPRVNYALLTSMAVKIPETYEEAMVSPFREEWKGGMSDELASLQEKGTWELVEPPKEEVNIIKNKWVFTTKTDEFGNVTQFIARLTAKGYSQIPGFDFEETHAPVPDNTSVRNLLALVVIFGWICEQLDIKSAFLNSILQFLCYMEQPQGFHDGSNRILRLYKSIYGLKQGAHDWYETFRAHLKSLGFR